MAQPAQPPPLLRLASAGGSGAFWEDRHHCTLVDGGEHAFNCIRYIDLNMVRAGVVGHPLEWRWCGHDELVGRRRRYRLLDLECVLKWLKMEREQFQTRYSDEIAEAVRDRSLRRDPVWTESVAVGGRAFVERVSAGLRNRRRLETLELSEGLWTVREAEAAYESPGDGCEFLSRTPAPMVAEVSPQSACRETSAYRDQTPKPRGSARGLPPPSPEGSEEPEAGRSP